jgi:cytidine deaminase
MEQKDKLLRELKTVARNAAENSYSPYSRFPVGAAVISGAGQIYGGCNVENASFGLTQCAERVAVTAAIADGAGAGSLGNLLIYTPGNTAHTPCGACRQVMHELLAKDSVVVSCCDGDDLKTWARADYLPDPFTPEALSTLSKSESVT